MLGKHFEKISSAFKTAFFILLSLQIAAGCIWGVYNCTSLRMFGDTTLLLKQSETLSVTGGGGVLYPALLAVVRTMTLNGPVRFYVVMYVLQAVLAFVSWFIFSGRVLGAVKVWTRIWISMAVITCPYAMQCHLAVLEYSFVSSLLCLLVTFQIVFIREWKKSENGLGMERALRDVCVISLFWLMLSLLRREFILLGMFPLAAVLLTILIKSDFKRKIMKICPLMLGVVFFMIIFMTDGLFRSGEKLGACDVLKRSLYYRVAWSEDLDELYQWPDYITNVVDRSVMHAVMEDPGLVDTVFAEAVQEKLGRADATDEMLSWARLAFRDNKKAIVIDTATEIAGYLFVPFFSEIKLRGIGLPGYTAGIYDVMRRNVPVFTGYYLRLSSVIYCFMMPLALIAAFINGRAGKLREFVPTCIMLVMAAVIYTFSGNNVWDQRKGLFAVCMWIACFAYIAIGDHKKTESTE